MAKLGLKYEKLQHALLQCFTTQKADMTLFEDGINRNAVSLRSHFTQSRLHRC